MRLTINRYKEDEHQTESDIWLNTVVSENFMCIEKEIFRCKGLELPWRDNKRRISRIPAGIYTGVKHISPNFGNSVWLLEVPNRSEILIHVGNFIGNPNPKTGKPDSLGCPIVGKKLADNFGTGIPNLVTSRPVINELYDLINDEITVEVIDNFK